MRFSLLAFLLSIASLPSWADPNLSNRRAPGFSVMDNTLQYRDLADYRGKLVLLELIQTTCPHCQDLTKSIVKAKQKFGDKIVVLSIVLPPDTPTTVAKFAKDYGLTSPILFDCGQVAASYVKADPRKPSLTFPHLFMIDAQGNIKNHFGPGAETDAITDSSTLAKEIDRLLAPAPANKK